MANSQNKLLLDSAKLGNIVNVQCALDHGADINCRDYYQWTPIHWALVHGHLDVFKFLLDKGAKATSEDLNKFLWMSVEVGNIDNVQYALDHGADINCSDVDQMTPIQWALEHDHLDVFKFLLNKGATVTSEDLDLVKSYVPAPVPVASVSVASAVSSTLQDETQLGSDAKEAIRRNISKLNDAISTSVFQSIVLECEQEGLISIDFKNELLSTTGVSTQTSAGQLTSHLQSTVELNPTSLDTLLCILVNKAGISGRAVADSIAQIYGHSLPMYEAIMKDTDGGSGPPQSTDTLCTFI